jgi:fucose permease
MNGRGQPDITVIRWLTVLMFMMFAMTTDSVGVVIPRIVLQFHLRYTARSTADHTATMI